MHEVGIMQNAVQMAVEQAKAQNARKIHCLRMRVGQMSGVVPEALEFAFEVVARGTMAEGAKLEVEWVKTAVWCKRCQTEFECEDYSAICPICGNWSSDWRRGRELELVSIEIS